jgi:hypothetical protein
MEHSAYAFATDLEDEGIDAVLGNLQERAGLTGVTLAAAYHAARDIFPHNPRSKMRFLEPGVCFHPDKRLYADTRLRPRLGAATGDRDTLARVTEAAAARGMQVHAWVVFLHVDAADDPLGVAPLNAFGDPFLTDLCPANPEVRAYAAALAADVARYRPASVVAESLHYPLLEHGYHHERYFLELGPLARFLLGLCFCTHCLDAARADGIDGEAVRTAVRAHLERVFDRGDPDRADDVSRTQAASLMGGELGPYLAVRERVVTSLVREVGEAARAGGSSLTFCDLSGAVKGFATGTPTGDPAAAIAWRFGIDWAALAPACDAVAVCGYAADPGRLEDDLRAYAERLRGAAGLSVVLRPTPPDCDSAENLRRKLAVAREIGARAVDFYHYGLAPLRALDLVRAALA